MAQQSSPATAVTPGAPPPKKQGFSVASKRGSTLGTIVKILLLGMVAAIAVFSILPLIEGKHWLGVGIVVVTTLVLFYIYLSPRVIPAKYLIVGTLFLIAFQVLPIVYTMTTAFTNFGDGHRGTKEEAIAADPGELRQGGGGRSDLHALDRCRRRFDGRPGGLPARRSRRRDFPGNR